jgi:hypothetical protein
LETLLSSSSPVWPLAPPLPSSACLDYDLPLD